MHDLIQKASFLHKRCTSFLNQQVAPYLEKYGSFEVVGSYALDLMVWPDLDIQFKPNQEDAIQVIGELSKDLLKDENVKSIKLINFYKRPNTKFAAGICMMVHYLPIDDLEWKADIWIQNRETVQQTLARTQTWQALLEPSTRQLILKWKTRLLNDQNRVIKHGSQAVYEAILEKGHQSDSEIEAYLHAKLGDF